MQDLDTLLLINTTLSRASTVVGPALRVEYAQDAAGLLAFICGKVGGVLAGQCRRMGFILSL